VQISIIPPLCSHVRVYKQTFKSSKDPDPNPSPFSPLSQNKDQNKNKKLLSCENLCRDIQQAHRNRKNQTTCLFKARKQAKKKEKAPYILVTPK